MFESTLEASGLHETENHVGSYSIAALAHVAVGGTILAVTAMIVHPIPPQEPRPIFTVVQFPPNQDDLYKRQPSTPPKKGGGGGVKAPSRPIEPAPVEPAPPKETPPELPVAPAEPPTSGIGSHDAGAEGPGHGPGHGPGVENGTDDGVDTTGGGPTYLTAEMERPVLLMKVEPVYPEVARRAGLTGRVTIQAVIDENGSIETADVIASKNPIFNQAAIDAVRKWHYRPATMNGRSIRVYFTVVVDFVIR